MPIDQIAGSGFAPRRLQARPSIRACGPMKGSRGGLALSLCLAERAIRPLAVS